MEPLFVARFPCPECGDEYDDRQEAADCCFVNYDCPFHCNTRHDSPPARPSIADRSSNRHIARWTCPGNGGILVWCEGCYDWYDYDDCEPVRIRGGDWYCGDERHDITGCDACGENDLYDNMFYSDSAEANYCSACYEPNGGIRAESRPGRCARCGTTLPEKPKVHPLTEEVTCDGCPDPEAVNVDDL